MVDAKSSLFQELVAELKSAVGEDFVLTSPVDLAVYQCDGETLDLARPDVVVLPASTEEVQSVVRLANKYRVPFTPRGAGTGLSGGATAIMGGISLVLTRMTKIISVEPDGFIATAQVGATNSSISRVCERYGLYFAPDPSSQKASTIGGNLAENSGGPHTLKYGTTINHVAGVKVVLPDGNITVFGGKARDLFGLDLLGVFVGSEGTLGVATEVTVRLTPKAESVETMLAYFPSVEQGGQAVSDIVAAGVVPAAMEMIDRLTLRSVEQSYRLGLNSEAGALLIVELDGARAAIELERQIVVGCIETHSAFGVRWAADAGERDLIWRARKSAFGALGRLAPHAYVLDGVIPRSKLADAISGIAEIAGKHEVVIANVYHAGDGNLHPALLYHQDEEEEVVKVMKAGREILELCVNLGGTLSGEHGIGVEKVVEMPFVYGEPELKAMEWLRDVFDPFGLCNPGKVLPNPKTCGESGARPLLRYRLGC